MVPCEVLLLGILAKVADPDCSPKFWLVFPWIACRFRADKKTLLHSSSCRDVGRALQLLGEFPFLWPDSVMMWRFNKPASDHRVIAVALMMQLVKTLE